MDNRPGGLYKNKHLVNEQRRDTITARVESGDNSVSEGISLIFEQKSRRRLNGNCLATGSEGILLFGRVGDMERIVARER
ncbi:hypothetical protein EVAR_2220_1 [Eumeta japonica]|uniref:Uncharacterized protein n=1 Tax=Eumeta variegata TaxID=151549 RepID=A0A4C1SFJ7_EUMVA|nr:hypothetical protein EVAR_2220_1 [Eumeta japonica]